MEDFKKQVRRKKTKTPNKPSSEEVLLKRILLANLTPFPGDFPLGNEALSREGLLADVLRLERRLARRAPFNELDTGLSGLPVAVKGRIYRWLCLLYEQNRVHKAEAAILRTRLSNALGTIFELRDELSEGMYGFVHHLVGQGKTLHEICAELLPLADRIQADFRERNKIKSEEKTKKSLEFYEHLRKRSGVAPLISQDIDWTQPHTEQEYVDAFAIKTIYARRVREFLRPFASKAQRRGAGRNKPLEYPFEAGMALLEHAVTNWITDSDKAFDLLHSIAVHQLGLCSALTAEGYKFASFLHRLWKNDKNPLLRSVRDILGPAIDTKDGWRIAVYEHLSRAQQ